MDWLTIQQLEKDTWVLSEPRHWEETHAYLLAGTEQALLIDTGLGVCDLFSAVRSLTSLPVTVALTHAHWDHIGGCNAFSPPLRPPSGRTLAQKVSPSPGDGAAKSDPGRSPLSFRLSPGNLPDLSGRSRKAYGRWRYIPAWQPAGILSPHSRPLPRASVFLGTGAGHSIFRRPGL